MGKLTRANRNIAWIERHCRVPEGKFVGAPLRLAPFMKRDLIKIYDNPDGTREAIISFAKKNAKTTLAACLMILHTAGPESVPNSQLYSTAQSRDQAATLFKLAAKMVRMSAELSDAIVVRDSAKQLFCPERGTEYTALSADATTAHGKSAVFAVHDELGQVRGPVSELYTAVDDAMSAHEAPLSIIISTQAASDGDLLSLKIDRAERGDDPHTVLSLYAAPIDAKPFSVAALKAANPGWDHFINKEEKKRQAREAKALPSQEPLYRNYQLNQRVNRNNPFISRSLWLANTGKPNIDMAGRKVWGGLDLAQRRDTTALVWVADDDLSVDPVFWLPGSQVAERSRLDRVPYDVWADEGYLRLSDGPTVDYMDIAREIMLMRQVADVQGIGFDPYLSDALWPLLEQLGMDADEREQIFHKFPQTYGGMSSAVAELEALLLESELQHGAHPVLTSHAANAVAIRGSVTDQLLLKKPHDTARIDGMVALSMAVGLRSKFMDEQVHMSTPWDDDPDFKLAV